MRRLALLMVALVASVSFTGCGSGDDADDQAGSPTHRDMGDMTDGMTDGGHMGDDHGEASPVADDARRVEVAARSFEFDPTEIQAEVGEDLAIVLTSEDILHDFTIDELDAHVAVEAGDTGEGGVRADEPGRYTFYCSVDGHRAAGMEGTLVVAA